MNDLVCACICHLTTYLLLEAAFLETTRSNQTRKGVPERFSKDIEKNAFILKHCSTVPCS